MCNTILLETIELVTARQVKWWLEAGYKIVYRGKEVSISNRGDRGDRGDDVVWGTDAYGQDYIAGYIADCDTVLRSFSRQTIFEYFQETNI